QLLRPPEVLPGGPATTSIGGQFARYGGVVASLAFAMDAKQYQNAGRRSSQQGDSNSALAYYFAGSVSAFNVLFAGHAALFTSALIGTLGIAITLGLIAYGLAALAKKMESTLLELWARQSRWGLPVDRRHWTKQDHIDEAIGALNAAVLGVDASAKINITFQNTNTIRTRTSIGSIFHADAAVPAGFTLDYNLTLPNFDPKVSRYSWQLTVFTSTAGGAITLISANDSDATPRLIANTTTKDIFPSEVNEPPTIKLSGDTLRINGSILLFDDHIINAIEITLTYWPDADDENGYAQVTSREDKISKVRQL
ncbi:hypothetical protein ACIP21_28130, partial [Pseudomonas sp. NPDC089401]